MQLLKKLCFALLILGSMASQSQNEIKPVEGYTPQIGIMVDMLEETKNLITANVKDLNQEQTDFLFDGQANSIGAMIMHLAATESYFQVETLEERVWTPEEVEFWGIAGGLGAASRKTLKGKPISYYLELWNQVRNKTLEGLKSRDDKWFASNIDEGINNHGAWFHILKHAANHMGQIELVKSRFLR